MRKIRIAFIFFILLSGSTQAQTTTSDLYQIHTLQNVLKETNQQMEWKVVIKETLDVEKVRKCIEFVENRHLVASTHGENTVQYRMDTNEYKDMFIHMNITHDDDMRQADVTIEIKGDTWNNEVATEYNAFMKDINDFYITPKARVFTCLSSTYSATISRNQVEKQVIEGLSLQSISTGIDPLTDSEKQSVQTAYSPLIQQSIRLEHDEIFNVQMVIKSLDTEEFSVMIGTPILIDEY